jgi:hypothetical protein
MQRGEEKKPFLESDMYPYVKEYLLQLGYKVSGEVGSCDVVAKDGETLIAVEMKRSLSMKLLLQGIERQEFCNGVYLALPVEGSSFPRNLKRYLKLIKKLQLGLLLVRRLQHRTRVELIFHPAVREQRRNRKGRQAILRELSGRSGDFTPGGSKGKVVTAYREEALLLACLLDRFGEMSPADLKRTGGSDRAGTILQDNHYGWFERVSRGIYRLHEAGKRALEEYPDLVTILRENTGTRNVAK